MVSIGRLLIALIKGYKKHISPGLGRNCRFTPTCSEYAIEAIATRGAIAGVGLAFWRIIRCNPLFKGGYDPVPQKGFKSEDRILHR